jgi:beta-N-acetylhexosaminidase
MLTAACTTRIDNTASAPPTTEVTGTLVVEESTSTTSPEVDPVPEILGSLTAEQKVGQLLMPMVYGTGEDVTAEEQQFNLTAHGYATPSEIVAAYNLGGVIYLEPNVTSAQQLTEMSRQLQTAANEAVGIGLLVAIDQEGGRVSRIRDEVTLFPPALDLAGDPRLVREASYVTGQQVQQQGINVVLAPVADVVEPGQPNFIGNRSFGNDPDLVASMVVAAVDGLQQSGVAAAVKHWPGHGATPVDSHLGLPTVEVDRAAWEERELPPFAAAIEEDVSIVLVGHLALPQLDPSGDPATVSPVLIESILRDELGFDGVVMTDALNMGAVADIPEGELVVASVNAGVDVVLIPPNLKATWSALNEAVADGTISPERLDTAVTRILRLKQDLGLLPDQ